jgi:hypothetical protein
MVRVWNVPYEELGASTRKVLYLRPDFKINCKIHKNFKLVYTAGKYT